MSKSNETGIFPAGRAVLVKPYEPDRKKSLIALPEAVQERQDTLNNRCIVIAIGPTAWHDEPRPRAAVGDKVMVASFVGHMITGPLDNIQYRLINDRDIFAVIVDNVEVSE
jgi:co-chaperonin GroES (HSP10)